MVEIVEKDEQSSKGGKRKYPIPEYEGIDADITFLKIAALFGAYREAVKLEIGVPVIADYEQWGLNYLVEDVLADLDLLIYGERTHMGWMDTEPKEEEVDNQEGEEE